MRTADSVLLTYWPPAPPDLNVSIAQIVGLDLDVAFAGFDLGNDVDRRKRRVAAVRRIERREPHETVHAALALAAFRTRCVRARKT